jgi:diguanylate cyclase (GGDEF)-like protein
MLSRVSIVTRIALAGVLTLLVFAIAMLFFMKYSLEQAIYSEMQARVDVAEKTMWEMVRAKGPPSLVGGKLRFGQWVANGDQSLVDHVRKLTGANATLFAVINRKPIRVATTIRKFDGSGRNVNTELVGPARAAFDRGRSFAGESSVAGRLFVNRYDAIRDSRGHIIGIVYTGIPLTALQEKVARAMRFAIVGTALALLASITLLYVAMRPLRRAFRNAVTIAQGLAEGDVAQRSNAVSAGELGAVSSAFRDMIVYQQRMAMVADALARGDFSMKIVPVSARDRLGIAFAHMSEQMQGLMQQLELSAMTDSLTQLGNRRAFDARMRTDLARAARRGGNVCLAVIDVDDFKAVNDEKGHQRGDAVLSKLADILRGLRAEDAAYRLGGDEFAVVFSDTSRANALVAFEQIRRQAEAELEGTTISIGLAFSPNGIVDAETLSRQADAALYACKHRGSNVVIDFEAAKSFKEALGGSVLPPGPV